MTKKEITIVVDKYCYSTTLKTNHWKFLTQKLGDEQTLLNERNENQKTCQRFYSEYYAWYKTIANGYNSEFACGKVLGISELIADEICAPFWGAAEGDDCWLDKIEDQVTSLLIEQSVGHFRLPIYINWTNKAFAGLSYLKKAVPADSKYYRYVNVVRDCASDFYKNVIWLINETKNNGKYTKRMA